MNERIHKYFYEELSTEERLSLLRDVEASEELKKEFAEYQNLYALLNLGHQVQDKTIGIPCCGSVGHAGLGMRLPF